MAQPSITKGTVQSYVAKQRQLLRESEICQGWNTHYPQQMNQLAGIYTRMSTLLDELEAAT